MNGRSMNWLKQRRQELQLSQEDLVRQLQLEGADVSRSALSSWETGRYNPPLDDKQFRQALAAALRLNIAEMLRRAEYEVLHGKHSDAGERAAHLIDRMKPEDQSRAIRILEAFQD